MIDYNKIHKQTKNRQKYLNSLVSKHLKSDIFKTFVIGKIENAVDAGIFYCEIENTVEVWSYKYDQPFTVEICYEKLKNSVENILMNKKFFLERNIRGSVTISWEVYKP